MRELHIDIAGNSITLNTKKKFGKMVGRCMNPAILGF